MKVLPGLVVFDIVQALLGCPLRGRCVSPQRPAGHPPIECYSIEGILTENDRTDSK